MSLLRVAGFAANSIVDGPGLRYAVFAQGCPHNCPGCHNPHTHAVSGGYDIDLREIAARINRDPLLDGVTLSGGEPFFQAEKLAELCSLLPPNLNVWCFSGYLLEELTQMPEALPLLRKIDVLVDGRFILEQRSLDLGFRGSANQRVIDVKQSLLEGKCVLLSE